MAIKELKKIVKEMDNIGCNFWACDGDHSKVTDMLTCSKCYAQYRIEKVIKKLEKEEKLMGIKPGLVVEYDEAKLLITALENSFFSLKQKQAGIDPEVFFKEREDMINRLKDFVKHVDKYERRRMA